MSGTAHLRKQAEQKEMGREREREMEGGERKREGKRERKIESEKDREVLVTTAVSLVQWMLLLLLTFFSPLWTKKKDVFDLLCATSFRRFLNLLRRFPRRCCRSSISFSVCSLCLTSSWAFRSARRRLASFSFWWSWERFISGYFRFSISSLASYLLSLASLSLSLSVFHFLLSLFVYQIRHNGKSSTHLEEFVKHY